MEGSGCVLISFWSTLMINYRVPTYVFESALDSSGSGKEQVACSCEHSNEPMSSIKCQEFLDHLGTYQTPWPNGSYGTTAAFAWRGSAIAKQNLSDVVDVPATIRQNFISR